MLEELPDSEVQPVRVTNIASSNSTKNFFMLIPLFFWLVYRAVSIAETQFSNYFFRNFYLCVQDSGSLRFLLKRHEREWFLTQP